MRRSTVILPLLLALTACGGTPTADLGPVSPYQTLTPPGVSTPLPARTEILIPTPTLFVHIIGQGDTLSGIADRYGVSLQALQDANPGVVATSLIVGDELIIPVGGVTTVSEPTPTPAIAPVTQSQCWPETTGGVWCFALVENEYAEPLENLSALFTLQNANGQDITSQTVYGLLDVLPPGASMPLAAHFPAPVDPSAEPRVQILTAIRLLPGDTRYLSAMTENTLVSVDSSGRTAQVTGRVVLTGSGTATRLWVLATAFDAAGNVVGVRRWESSSALTADAPVTFDFLVSSLGPGIDRVDFLTEARP